MNSNVRLSKHLQFDPFVSVYPLEDTERLREQEGVVLAKNTMGETPVQLAQGQWWIRDDFILPMCTDN